MSDFGSRPRHCVPPVRAGIVAGAIFCIFLMCYLILRPVTPETIRDRAIRALERRDVQELCSMADPEELSRLRLSGPKVKTILSESLWARGSVTHRSISLFSDRPSDRRSWLIDWGGNKSDHGMFGITAIDDPRIGWKLVLSDLLYSACCWSRPPRAGGVLYRELSRKVDISGVRGPNGSYEMYDR